MVSNGCRAGGVCHTHGHECLFWPMPPYYSYYLLYSSSTTSIEDSRYWLRSRVQYGYSKNTRTTREACEASTNSVLLLLIGLIREPVAMHVQLCIRKIFFCLIAPLTQRSDSKSIHKFSKFITGISFYYIQQVINPHRQ